MSFCGATGGKLAASQKWLDGPRALKLCVNVYAESRFASLQAVFARCPRGCNEQVH